MKKIKKFAYVGLGKSKTSVYKETIREVGSTFCQQEIIFVGRKIAVNIKYTLRYLNVYVLRPKYLVLLDENHKVKRVKELNDGKAISVAPLDIIDTEYTLAEM